MIRKRDRAATFAASITVTYLSVVATGYMFDIDAECLNHWTWPLFAMGLMLLFFAGFCAVICAIGAIVYGQDI